MNPVLFGIILTQLGLALGQMDTCSPTQRFNCIHGTEAVTEANCNAKPYCRWCPDERLKRRCQTSDRACIITDNLKEPTYTTKTTCEGAGFDWCGGPTTACVHDEPARELCFKLNIRAEDPCPNLHIGDEHGCNTDPAGCFYCTEAVTERINKCWKLPNSALCTGTDICCDNAACMRDFTEASCKVKGCNYCNDGGVEYCSFGPPPPEEPTPQPPPACPTTALVEDCYVGLPGRTPEEMECESLGCVWCTENGLSVCKRETFPATCDSGTQEQCDVHNLTNPQACKSWGCEWCGGASSNIECQKSTSCTNCDCPDPQPCEGSTPQACGLNGCLWCDNGTTVGNYSCINMNSGGVTPDKANNWTECSRSCDEGTEWRFSECPHPNPCSCPREFRTCNLGPCPCRTSCPHGIRYRYDDSDTCCQSHTFVCGRNTLNENRPPPSTSGRKKRVVGGAETGSVEKWPWLVVIYFNISGPAATKCTGTLIADKWVITAANCVSGNDPTDSEVHLDVYDRNQAPGVTRGVVQFHIEPSDMNVALVELDAVITPYSQCVHPLCMPSGEEAEQDRKCVVAGWGATNASDPTACTLIPHDATVRVMDYALCQQTWSGMAGGLNMDDHFCAGIPEGGKDTCTGDLGAPLMCQRCENCAWYLAGVATDYVSCGAVQASSVYYRIAGDVEAWVAMQFTALEDRPYSSCAPGDES